MRNFYDVLGVDKNATQDDIKQAYRRLARKYHPDVSKESNAEEQFKEVQTAYATLSNPQKRQQYDHSGMGQEQVWQRHQFDDIFGGSFADFINKNFRQQRIINTIITLEEAYTGTLVKIMGNQYRIPPGVRHGTKFSINNETIASIHIQPHLFLERHNDDLLLKVDLSLAEAVCGTELEIQHLSGNKLKARLPGGIAQGQAIKLNGQGMPNPQLNRKGDLFIQVNSIGIPDGANLTEEQKKVIMSTGYRTNVKDFKRTY